MAVMVFVFSCMGVCLPRVVLELMRELALEARHRNPQRDTIEGEYGPVVVLGAGNLGVLFLDHLKSSPHEIYPKMRVLGFLDDSRVLHGRRIRSFHILGDLGIVPELVTEKGLKGIVLAIRNPSHELLEHLSAVARTFGLNVYRWQVGLEVHEIAGTKLEPTDLAVKVVKSSGA